MGQGYAYLHHNHAQAFLTVYCIPAALEITGHDTPIIVGLSGSINCSTLLGVSKIEWYIRGFDDPVESGSAGVNSLVLTLNPESTALNGTSVICQVTATSGVVYEETVTLMIKGSLITF